MAITSIGDRGTGVAGATASTSVAANASANVVVGRVLVVSVISPTATHSSVTDAAGNTYTKIAESSGNSQTQSVWISNITTQLNSGSAVTANFGSSIADKCIGLWEFQVGSGKILQESATDQTNTSTGSGFGSLSFSSLSSKERLFWRGCGKNANSTTALTATTNFTSAGWTIRSRNNTAARILRAEFRINTSTGETSNPTFAVTGNYATVFVALEEADPPLTGTVSATTPVPTLAASGSPLGSGTAAPTTPLATLAASGTSTVAGTVAATTAVPTLGASLSVGAVGGFNADADGLKGSNASTSDRNWSVCGWFKYVGAPTGTDSNVIFGMDQGVGYSGAIKNIELTDTGAVQIRDNFGAQNVGLTLSGSSGWYFFCLVCTNAYDLTLYWRAEAAGSLSSSTKTGTNTGDVMTGVAIGANANFSSWVDGSFSRVRVFNKALSSAEALAESNSASPVITGSDLLAAYPLDSAASKLTATTGSNLTTLGSGSWSDVTGPTFGGSTNGTPIVTGSTSASTPVPTLAASGDVGGALSGTVAATTPLATLAASGSPIASGTVAASTSSTLAASGTPIASGTVAASTSSTLAASGSPIVAGTVAASTSSTLAASGSPIVTGSESASTAVPGLAASGTPIVTGSSSASTPVPTLAASGSVGSNVTGTLAATTPLATLAASGTPIVAGTVAASTSSTLAASGTPVVTGSSSASAPVPSISASGSPVESGSASIVAPAPVLAASGTPIVTGSTSASTPVPTLAAVGEVLGTVTGTVSATTPPATLAAAGGHPALRYAAPGTTAGASAYSTGSSASVIPGTAGATAASTGATAIVDSLPYSAR